MHIHGAIRPLPPGIAVAAQRRSVDGQDVIVSIVSETYAAESLRNGPHGGLMKLFLDAVNQLLNAPERSGPVHIPEPMRLVS